MNLVIKTSFFILLLFLVGCSTQPAPYSIQRNSINEYNFNNTEKHILFNGAVKSLAAPLKVPDYYKKNYNCILVPPVGPVACFIQQRHRIYRKDLLDWSTNETLSTKIQQIQKNLPKTYQLELDNFAKFTKLYNEGILLSKKKLKSLRIIILDETNILPENIKHNILRDVRVRYVKHNKNNKAINAYKKLVMEPQNKFLTNTIVNNFDKFFQTPKDLEDVLPIKIYLKSPTQIYDRYRIDSSLYLKKGYYSLPKKVTLKINKISFDYIPKVYKISDKNIDVVVTTAIESDRPGVMTRHHRYIQKFKIINKTKDFINIDKIHLFSKNDNRTNIIRNNDKIEIEPNSSKHIATNIDGRFNWLHRWVSVKDVHQKINYGYAVIYTINGKKKKISKIKSYNITDFQKGSVQ